MTNPHYEELAKQCRCGRKMAEIIGHDESENPKPYRKGWYCTECRCWEDAILRETWVNIV